MSQDNSGKYASYYDIPDGITDLEQYIELYLPKNIEEEYKEILRSIFISNVFYYEPDMILNIYEYIFRCGNALLDNKTVESVNMLIKNSKFENIFNFNTSWKTVMDIIEDKNMNFASGEIFKAAFTFGRGRHAGTTLQRDVEKVVFYSMREYNRLLKKHNMIDIKPLSI